MGSRDCTDKFCCFIYMIFVLACIGITGYGYVNGKPENMLVSFDNIGRRCGNASIAVQPEGSFKDYPVKFFVNLKTAKLQSAAADGSIFIGVCAKTCPKANAKLNEGTDYVPIKGQANSKSNVAGELTNEFDTAQIGQYCVPSW
jgi:hypothetical protein